jgi:hypothetical protein
VSKQLLKDGLGWGVLLWLIGYILGIVFFMFVPKNMIGWAITPIGIFITLWVLTKKIKNNSLGYFLKIGTAWTLIALVFDYLFIVQLFKSGVDYYKPDVYLYYALTFILPVVVGWRKQSTTK